jgi:ribonuclease P protein component
MRGLTYGKSSGANGPRLLDGDEASRYFRISHREGTSTKDRSGLETDFPTQSATPGEDARVSSADANRGWSQHAETTSAKRALSPHSMTEGESSHSFPKALRLLRRPEFRKVYDEGRRGNARVCTIFYRSNGLPRTRVGITTPRSLGKAVVRNRIRRRLREVIRLNQAVIAPGWDVVLNPRPAIAELPFPVLVRKILDLMPASAPGNFCGQRRS